MTASTFAAEVAETSHAIEAGALLLRQLAALLRTGNGETRTAVYFPHQMAFIADGLLGQVENLRYAMEQFLKAPEAADIGKLRVVKVI